MMHSRLAHLSTVCAITGIWAAQLAHSIGKVTAAKFDEGFKRIRALFVD